MRSARAAGISRPNPYESPTATPATPRRRVVAQATKWLRIAALVVFALATLGGLYRWFVIQFTFGVMSGRLSADVFPILPTWLLQFLGYSLLLGTPLAIVLLTLVCRRISLPLWIVIAPLIVFDIWISLTPIANLLWESGWQWPRLSGFTHAVSINTGRAMIPVTAAAFVALLIVWRKVPPHLWFVILPAFALDLWFIWGWLDLQ